MAIDFDAVVQRWREQQAQDNTKPLNTTKVSVNTPTADADFMKRAALDIGLKQLQGQFDLTPAANKLQTAIALDKQLGTNTAKNGAASYLIKTVGQGLRGAAGNIISFAQAKAASDVADQQDYARNVAQALVNAAAQNGGEVTKLDLFKALLSSDTDEEISYKGWQKDENALQNIANGINAGMTLKDNLADTNPLLFFADKVKDFYNLSANAISSKVNDKTLEQTLTDKAEKAIPGDNYFSKKYQEVAEEMQIRKEDQSAFVQGAGNVVEAISSMAPAIAASIVAKNPQIALLTISAQAGGAKAEEAVNAGASAAQAWRAAQLAAGKEYAVERMFGGIIGLGKGVVSTAGGKALKSVGSKVLSSNTAQMVEKFMGSQWGSFAKYLANIGGEMAEETISQLLDSYIDRAVFDPNAARATKAELKEAAIIGGGVSAILGLPVAFSSTNTAQNVNINEIVDQLAPNMTAEERAAFTQALQAEIGKSAISFMEQAQAQTPQQTQNQTAQATQTADGFNPSNRYSMYTEKPSDLRMQQIQPAAQKTDVNAVLDAVRESIGVPSRTTAEVMRSISERLGITPQAAQQLPTVQAEKAQAVPKAKATNSKVMDMLNQKLAETATRLTNVQPVVNSEKVEREHSSVANMQKAAENGFTQQGDVLASTPEDDKTYVAESMEETQGKAQAWINKNGGVEKSYNTLLQKKTWGPEQLEAAVELERAFATYGKTDEAVVIFSRIMEHAKAMGQAINYMKMFQRISPVGFEAYAIKVAKDAGVELTEAERGDIRSLGQAAMDGRITAKTFSEASPEMQKWLNKVQAYVDKGRMTEEQFGNIIVVKIMDITYGKLPAKTADMFRALQRISMLSNPKTHIRNIQGNALNVLLNTAAQPLSKTADALMSLWTQEKTFTALPSVGAAAKGAIKGVQNVAMETMLGVDTGETKYMESLDGAGRRNAFVNKGIGKALNNADKAIATLLKFGDEPFRNGRYEEVLAELVRANPQAVESNGGKPTAEMIETAYRSSLRMTFQDDNKVSDIALEIRKALDSVGVPIGSTIAPFVKTPANVIRTALEFSPIGTVEAIAKTFCGKNSLRALRKSGKSTLSIQRDVAELFGKGFVGTGLVMLGGLLKSLGAMTDDEPEDKELAYEQAKGWKANSLKIGDTYIDPSTIQIGTSALAAGAQSGIGIGADGSFSLSNINIMDIANAAGNVGLNALDMPMLEGVLNLLGGKWDDESIAFGVIGLVGDALTGAIPLSSLSRQVATALDPYQRSTDTAKEGFAGIAESTLNQLKSTIPGWRKTLPQVYDVLGNPKKTYEADTPAGRLLNVFLNPNNTYKENTSAATGEIDRLYKLTNDSSVLPTEADNYIEYKGKKVSFTPEQKQEYQQKIGSISSDGIFGLLKSDMYGKLTNNQKADLVSQIYKYAGVEARAEIFKENGIDYETDDTKALDKLAALEDAGLTKSEALVYRTLIKDISGGEEQAKFINGLSLTAQQKKALENAYISDWQVIRRDIDSNYSSNDTFTLSLLSDKAQGQWSEAKSTFGKLTAQEYSNLVDIINDSDYKTKETKLVLIRLKMGWTTEQAELFWDIVKDNKKR